MALNAFRLAGDMSHVLSIVILLLRLQVAKSAVGKRKLVAETQSTSKPTRNGFGITTSLKGDCDKTIRRM